MASHGDKKDGSLLMDDYSPLPKKNEEEKITKPYTNEDKLEEWRVDLTKLEYEIQTLKSVLVAKHREANDLRRKLGITQISEIKQDLQYGIQAVKESNAFQKTSSAFRNFGSFASQKVGNLRNSMAFKSVEGKVGTAYTSVKHSKSIDSLKSHMGKLKPGKSTDGYERELDDKADGLSEPFETPEYPDTSAYNAPSEQTLVSDLVKKQAA